MGIHAPFTAKQPPVVRLMPFANVLVPTPVTAKLVVVALVNVVAPLAMS